MVNLSLSPVLFFALYPMVGISLQFGCVTPSLFRCAVCFEAKAWSGATTMPIFSMARVRLGTLPDSLSPR